MTANKSATIGAFVLGGLILALCTLIFFGNFSLFSHKKHAIIIFPGSVSGLSVGAPVTFRGVQVGSVDSVKLQFDTKKHKAFIPVVINFDPRRIGFRQNKDSFNNELQEMVNHGLQAEISTESFVTGTSNIFLDFDKDNPAIFHPEMADNMLEIPAHPSTIQKIKSELMNLQLEKLSKNTNETILKIGKLADQISNELPPLVTSFRSTSDNASVLLNNVNRQLNSTIQNFNRLLTTSNEQINNRGKDIHKVLVSTDKTLADISALMENLKSITSPRAPFRNNMESISRNLADAAASLRGFSNEIERNPKLLLIGRRQ